MMSRLSAWRSAIYTKLLIWFPLPWRISVGAAESAIQRGLAEALRFGLQTDLWRSARHPTLAKDGTRQISRLDLWRFVRWLRKTRLSPPWFDSAPQFALPLTLRVGASQGYLTGKPSGRRGGHFWDYDEDAGKYIARSEEEKALAEMLVRFSPENRIARRKEVLRQIEADFAAGTYDGSPRELEAAKEAINKLGAGVVKMEKEINGLRSSFLRTRPRKPS